MLHSEEKHTNPELRVHVTETILVLCPSPVEVNRTISPPLNHLEEAYDTIHLPLGYM